MALKLYNETDIEAIADAIRGKNGSSDTYKVSQMATAIGNIPSGGGGWDVSDYLDMSTPSGELTSTITALPSGGEQYVFQGRTGITSISLPNLLSFASHAFNGAKAQHIYVPSASVTNYSQNAFANCTNLETLALPSATGNIYNGFFSGCSNLEAVDLCVGGFQQSDHFKNCTKLKTLVLRTSSVASLAGTGIFNGTPFASNGTGGTLYVPQSLISSYQSATNWSTILGYANNQIKAIEGSVYETKYADGTSISS